jgi:hypothetical protein
MAARVRPGERYIVFDAGEWQRTGDVGDNSKFRKPARVVRVYVDAEGNEKADVEFEDGKKRRISTGHFVAGFGLRLTDA